MFMLFAISGLSAQQMLPNANQVVQPMHTTNQAPQTVDINQLQTAINKGVSNVTSVPVVDFDTQIRNSLNMSAIKTDPMLSIYNCIGYQKAMSCMQNVTGCAIKDVQCLCASLSKTEACFPVSDLSQESMYCGYSVVANRIPAFINAKNQCLAKNYTTDYPVIAPVAPVSNVTAVNVTSLLNSTTNGTATNTTITNVTGPVDADVKKTSGTGNSGSFIQIGGLEIVTAIAMLASFL